MQCLCIISRKKWVMKLMFCMLTNMEIFYKLMVLFLMGLAIYVIVCVTSAYCYFKLREAHASWLGLFLWKLDLHFWSQFLHSLSFLVFNFKIWSQWTKINICYKVLYIVGPPVLWRAEECWAFSILSKVSDKRTFFNVF